MSEPASAPAAPTAPAEGVPSKQEPTAMPARLSRQRDNEPSRRLTELIWPAEPDSRLWYDPLYRNDVKPLRPFEYEAIATSPLMRQALADREVRAVLARLATLEPSAIKPSIRLLLSLPAEAPQTTYRPGTSSHFATSLPSARLERDQKNAQDRRQKQRGPALMPSSEAERKAFGVFADIVDEILEDARKSEGV